MTKIHAVFFILYGAMAIYAVYINDPQFFLRGTIAVFGFGAILIGVCFLLDQARNK